MKKLLPREVNTVCWIALAVGAAIGMVGALSDSEALAVVGVLVMIGGMVFRLISYRCPHCGTYLDRSRGEYCPHCGEKVNVR